MTPRKSTQRIKPPQNPADKASADTTEATTETNARARMRVPAWAALSGELRTLGLNLALIAIAAVMIPVIALQFLNDQVIIDRFEVPPAMAARGLTADVVANRLWDGLAEVKALAASSKEGIAAIPQSQRVQFSLPDSGISIDGLVYHVRQFFHLYPTRIGGEFTCADAECRPDGISLRLRVIRQSLEVIQMPVLGAEPEPAYFRAAAAEVLGRLDPFLAAAYQVQANPEAGLAEAERLVAQGHPDAVWAWNLIGTTRMTLGQTDAAIAAFRGALRVDPGFVIAQTNLGSALVQKGDLAGASALFDTVARTDPRNRFLALGRYRLALAQGQPDAAIAQVMLAEAVDPGTAMYLFLAAEAAQDAGDTTRATGFLDRALRVAPGDGGAVALRVLIHQMAGDHAGSAAVLDRALAVSPDDAGFLKTRASVRGLLNRFEDALADIDRVIALTPQDVAAQKTRAATLQALNRHDAALAQLDPMVKADPKNAELAYMQGQSLQALGRADAARRAYRTAVDLDPTGITGIMAQAVLTCMP